MSTFTREQREDLKALFRELTQEARDSDQLSAALRYLQDTPVHKNAGYYSPAGGTDDPHNKSFGDFLLAIARHDRKRLTKVYGSRLDSEVYSTKDIQLEDGPSGGYLVPEEYNARLLQATADAAVVRPRATLFPVSAPSGKVPSLNQYTAPSAGSGDTAFAGGFTLAWTAPGGTLTEDQPTFEQIEYSIRKLAGYTEVENEVISDSPFAMENLLMGIFGVAVAGMEDHAFLRGDGVAEPLGVLNADALVQITPSTDNSFSLTDAGAMRARFKPVGGNPVWVMHQGVLPDLLAFEVSSGSGGVWIPNLAGQLPENLLGFPYLFSEHLPQDDNSGDVILADFRGYAIFDRGPMAIAFSEHAAFTSDKGTWRVTKRVDGQPWLAAAITLADPQAGYTVSAFISHND